MTIKETKESRGMVDSCKSGTGWAMPESGELDTILDYIGRGTQPQTTVTSFLKSLLFYGYV